MVVEAYTHLPYPILSYTTLYYTILTYTILCKQNVYKKVPSGLGISTILL